MEEAQVKERRGALLEALRSRFPEVITPDVLQTINQQPSLPLLRDWFKAALSATTADDFLAVLRR
jgi:hypothetical protein